MIDVRALRENPEPARASQRARGANPGLVDEIIEADAARREALQAFETLRATQKEVSKSVGRASKEERPAILAKAKELAEQVKAAEAAANAADAEAARLLSGFSAGSAEELEATLPMTEAQSLRIHLARRADGTVAVLAWQTVPAQGEDAPAEADPLPVFDGTLPAG